MRIFGTIVERARSKQVILMSKLVAFVLITSAVMAAAGVQPQSQMVGMESSYSRIISPVAMLTVLARGEGTSAKVSLLVLWRGSPGWFMKPGPRGGGGGGRTGRRSVRLEYGGLDLRVELDEANNAIWVQNKAVPLQPPDSNVLLVDFVDDSKGPVVIKTLRIEPSLPEGDRRLNLSFDALQRSFSFSVATFALET